jgi:hypothetical protein
MNALETGRPVLPAALVAAGVALGGLLIGTGFARGRAADRYVEVKGVAEREVKADIALWPLRLVAAGNDLADVQTRLARHTAQVYAFLRRHGVDTSLTEIQSVEVTDAYANIFGGERTPAARYVASQTVMVRTGDVDVVLAASQRTGELISAGVVLSSTRMGYGPGGPTFLFTKLNDLKPAMIQEATGKAREAATQFAADSRSGLGGIRQANQGVFVILPRDQAPGVSEESQPFKTVRVVTTVQYYLKS